MKSQVLLKLILAGVFPHLPMIIVLSLHELINFEKDVNRVKSNNNCFKSNDDINIY